MMGRIKAIAMKITEAIYQNIRDTNEITFPSLIGVDREKKCLE